ncbi:MAG: sugar phosphate isomerase/epimerase [Oscillospiraceae bacterium]|nr:sugar phosphate isomerase/epimerase [Oscillospiraceae bacterium]
MKLAFSTVGCPDWTFDEIFAAAVDFGYDAIEIRGMGNEICAPKLKIFSDFSIDSTMEKLRNSNLTISMFTSNSVIGFPDIVEEAKKEAFDYIDLAYKAGVPFVRVFISPRPEADEIDMNCAVSAYSEICEYAKDKKVTPLIETNGVFADSKVLAEFMRRIDCENKGVLWDVHHPYRFFNEAPEYTFENIGGYLKYMHIKDSVYHSGKLEYRMVGYGDVPIYDILKLVSDGGYSGFLSLEWTKRWLPELQEPGIVFSHYINYMRDLIEEVGKSK